MKDEDLGEIDRHSLNIIRSGILGTEKLKTLEINENDYVDYGFETISNCIEKIDETTLRCKVCGKTYEKSKVDRLYHHVNDHLNKFRIEGVA